MRKSEMVQVMKEMLEDVLDKDVQNFIGVTTEDILEVVLDMQVVMGMHPPVREDMLGYFGYRSSCQWEKER